MLMKTRYGVRYLLLFLFITANIFISYYPPKESSLEPHRGVPLFGDAFSSFIRFFFFHFPYDPFQNALLIGWLGGWFGWVSEWAYLPVPFFLIELFFFIFIF